MNHQDDSSLELGLWIPGGLGEITEDEALDGVKSGLLVTRRGITPELTSTLTAPPMTDLVPGELYLVDWWHKDGNPCSNQVWLLCEVDIGTGFIQIGGNQCNGDDEWHQEQYDYLGFIPTSPNATLRFRSTQFVPSGILFSRWYVDCVTVATQAEREMQARRRTIKEALVTQAKTISIANGYNVDVGSVVGDRTAVRDVQKFPALAITYIREEHDVDYMHGTRVEAEYLAQALARGSNSDDVCDDLMADVEKCFETQSNGQWLGLGYVRDVKVTSVDPEEPGEEKHRETRRWESIVKVTFVYDRATPSV